MIMPTVDVLEPPSRVSDSSGQLSWAQKSRIAPVLSNLEVRPCPPSCLVPISSPDLGFVCGLLFFKTTWVLAPCLTSN